MSYDDDVRLNSTIVATDSFPITPSDSGNLPRAVRSIRANGAGVVSVTTEAGQRRDMNFGAGETRFVMVSKVWATGTTATGLEGMP